MKTISKILSIVLVLSMVLGFALVGRAANSTASVTISTYADTNNWADATKYTSIQITNDIKADVTGGGNSGKYYVNGENWRLYQTESPTLKITASNGLKIVSVKFTFNYDNGGVLTRNGSNVTSGTTVSVDATSVSFGVSSSTGKTNGQVKITKIEVVYTESTAPACDHAASKLSWEKDASQHWQVCSCGGYTSTKANHSGNPCSACGFTTVPVTNGTYVIAIGNNAFSAIAEDKTYGYLPGSEVTISGGVVTAYTNANIFTVTNTTGNKFTIKDYLGRYVYMDGDYASFSYDDEMPSAGAEWLLVQNGNVVLLKNVAKNKNVEYTASYSTFQANATANADVDFYAATVITQCSHEYTNEYDASCNICADTRDVTLPAANSTLTLDVAEKLGLAQNHNSYTSSKYYVEGEVTEVTSEQYGNMKIKDANGKVLVIYGSYDSTGEHSYKDIKNAPKAGDKIKIYGGIGQYNGTAQMKNGWIMTVNGEVTVPNTSGGNQGGNTGSNTGSNNNQNNTNNPKDGDAMSIISVVSTMILSMSGVVALVIKKRSF